MSVLEQGLIKKIVCWALTQSFAATALFLQMTHKFRGAEAYSTALGALLDKNKNLPTRAPG
jgi:hypothetical protein